MRRHWNGRQSSVFMAVTVASSVPLRSSPPSRLAEVRPTCRRASARRGRCDSSPLGVRGCRETQQACVLTYIWSSCPTSRSPQRTRVSRA